MPGGRAKGCRSVGLVSVNPSPQVYVRFLKERKGDMKIDSVKGSFGRSRQAVFFVDVSLCLFSLFLVIPFISSLVRSGGGAAVSYTHLTLPTRRTV